MIAAVLKITLLVAIVYIAAVAFLAAVQDRLLFPADLAASVGTPVPAGSLRMEITTPDGERLSGVRLVPPAAPVTDRVIILAFAGNAWNAEDAAVYLQALFPAAEIVAFHYRGYRPSTGRASVKALIADAPLIYDEIRKTAEYARIVPVGFSVGAGVAVHLARDRKVDGLILVTPFDSLAALAADHFPWAPAAWLVRHPMPNAEVLRTLDVPLALIVAEQDTIVPGPRASEIRGGARRLVYSRTVPGADHNDLYQRQDFAVVMQEALAALEAAWQ